MCRARGIALVKVSASDIVVVGSRIGVGGICIVVVLCCCCSSSCCFGGGGGGDGDGFFVVVVLVDGLTP